MRARIAVLAGDGIGPEVIEEGVRCLTAVAQLHGHEVELRPLPFGGAAIDSDGDPLPPATLRGCLEADAVLLGAIGGPKWSAPDARVRPEAGLLRLAIIRMDKAGDILGFAGKFCGCNTKYHAHFV